MNRPDEARLAAILERHRAEARDWHNPDDDIERPACACGEALDDEDLADGMTACPGCRGVRCECGGYLSPYAVVVCNCWRDHGTVAQEGIR